MITSSDGITWLQRDIGNKSGGRTRFERIFYLGQKQLDDNYNQNILRSTWQYSYPAYEN